ncbi:MAG TPA: 2-succinyl-5-enolpyruvyl-6-hydroxy-3-cyclohexene-1-carboxylic-acid synthase [Paludibacteraceae bacterium]|nr:2-succinyl-5-enolpyruvyl-6-hydroxy-3-cyclohexene-1-carboxylic-acid synthase [Paludibacteraceae bacterium]
MVTTDKKIVRTLVDLCVAHGVENVVLSPGSRNAPLSIAFNRESKMTCRVIVDERSAAFFALGLALSSNKPVVVVCTSGTALLNLAPAVAEAYYQKVPLIVVSADRPLEWIDQNDSQTIRQSGALSNFVKRSYQLPMNEDADALWYANRIINDALITAVSGRKAPVHINVPLSEPLCNTVDSADEQRVVRHVEPQSTTMVDESLLNRYASQFNSCQKVMILSGFMRDVEPLRELVRCYADIPSVSVVTEPISNVFSEKTLNSPELFFSYIINYEEPENFVPDLLITMGGAIVSKSAKIFLRNNPPKFHWHISEEEWTIDTFQCLTDRMDVDPFLFLTQLKTKTTSVESSYSDFCKNSYHAATAAQQLDLEEVEWSDLKAFSILLPQLQKNTALHLSNGLSVRTAQRLPLRSDLRLYSNRGTSGIDGATSTAVGFSCHYAGKTILITGDISFLYDSNGLWNNYLSGKFGVVVINNGGGSIFKRLKGPSSVPELNDYFVTPHHVDLQKMADLYGLKYFKATNQSSLTSVLSDFLSEQNSTSLLEILC